MFDLISIGDVTVDNFVQIHDAEVKCNLDKKKCLLCLEYGDKIPVDHLSHQVGGNAANSAVGAQRLKLKSASYLNIGEDPAGTQIKEKLKKEGVDLRYLISNKNMESNMSTVITFKGERTILVYHQDWKYNLPDLDKAKWVYFTSTAESLTQSNLVRELEQYLQRTGARLLFSPGTHQIKSGIKKNPGLLSLTEILVVNKEEAERVLYGKETGGTAIKKLLSALADLGPKMVVITDATEGSYGFDGETYYQIGTFPSKLVEMTGAGDGYATGLLAGLFYGKDLKEAMRWGTANGASVVEQIGPQAGLLTYSGMLEKLKANSKIIAKEI